MKVQTSASQVWTTVFRGIEGALLEEFLKRSATVSWGAMGADVMEVKATNSKDSA